MIGKILASRYRLNEEIGRGGMGAVYRAHDPVLDRDVAIKLIPPQMLKPGTEERFQREAQLVARMDHPAIVPVFDYGSYESSLFLVMPVITGIRLRDLLREGSVKLSEILRVAIEVAEALDYSHRRGVIHRDIKPENIMVTKEDGNIRRVRVMDFGLALAQRDTRLTDDGALMGTIAYISPEQVEGRPLDGAADIYSLGTVLYECLCGQLPFTGNFPHLLLQIVNQSPMPPRGHNPNIDAGLEAIVLRCLAKDPSQRFRSGGELAAALRRQLGESGSIPPPLPEASTRVSLSSPTRMIRLAAREKELNVLEGLLAKAVNDGSRFVLVSGEAGVGKTRVLEELERIARARGVPVLHGRFVEHDRGFPYQGFCELIQDYFRTRENEMEGGSSPVFDDLTEDLVGLFPILSEMIGTPSKPQAQDGDPAMEARTEEKTRISDLLARTLIRLSENKPLVLLLEDLHGADVSLDALRYIVPRMGMTPALILGSYRTEEVDRRHPLHELQATFQGHPRFTALSLAPFNAEEHRLLVRNLLGGGDADEKLEARLFSATEGNALFTVEVVRSLLESGEIVRDDQGTWRLADDFEISAHRFPETIREAVKKRVDRLPPEAKHILSVAAIIGRDFEERDIAGLREGRDDLDEALDRLVNDGLLQEVRRSRGDRLSFASGLVRDVLYRDLSRRRRRTLHRRYADYLETRFKEKPDRVYPELAHHFALGDVPDKSIEYGMLAAKKFLETFSAEEVIRSLKNVFDFFDEDWEGDPGIEGEAYRMLARAEHLRGRLDAALRAAHKAAALFQERGDASQVLNLARFAADAAWRGRRVDETRQWVECGIATALALDERTAHHHFLALAATVATLRGDHEASGRYLEEIAALERDRGEKGTEPLESIPSGGSLTAALTNPLPTGEPALLETNEESEVFGNVYETLLRIDGAGNLVPVLAETWELLEEGRVVRLNLRKGVPFHDGHILNANDVRTSFERAIGLKKNLNSTFGAISGARDFASGKAKTVQGLCVVGSHQLEIRLSEVLPLYPMLLTDIACAVARVSPSQTRGLLGTGPFRLRSHEAGRVVLEKNPEHWLGNGGPKLDKITFQVVPNAAACAEGLRDGRFDLALDLLPEEVESFLRDPEWRPGFVEAPKKNLYFAVFNANSRWCGRELLRRVLVGSFSGPDLVWQTLGRLAQPATGLIPPGVLGHDPGRKTRRLPRAELEAMIGRLDCPLPLMLRAAVHPVMLDRYGALTRDLFRQWSELGIEVAIVTESMESFLKAQTDPADIDMMLGRWNADYEDPDAFTYSLFHSESGLVRHFFSSEQTDLLARKGRTEIQPSKRRKIYRDFESLILGDDVLLPLFHGVDFRLANGRVAGLRLRNYAPFVNYDAIGIRQGRSDTMRRSSRTGVIRVPLSGVVPELDPALVSTVEQAEVIPNIFETLTRDLDGANIVPWLASEFRPEKNGRRFRFLLRDDVYFHDGRKLTARDVRYSLERMLVRKESNGRVLFSPILGARDLIQNASGDLAGFKVVSAREFTIDLETPISFFPSLLTHMAAAVIPEGSDPNLTGRWTGTGAFKVRHFETGKFLELEANAGYWRPGYPKSQRLIFYFEVPPDQIFTQFQSGYYSIACDLFPQDVDALFQIPKYAEAYREVPRLTTYFAAFRRVSGHLAHLETRRRLVQALSRGAMVRRTLGRLGIPARGLIPPGLLGYRPGASPLSTASNSSSNVRTFSGRLALTAALHPVFFGEYALFADHLLESLKKQGIDVKVVNRNNPRYDLGQTLEGEGADLVLGRWIADYPDADSFVRGLLHSEEGYLKNLCPAPEIDRLVAKASSETEPLSRQALYEQVEDIIHRQALLLPLFHEQLYRFPQPELTDFELTFSKPAVNYEKLSLR